MRSPGRIDIGEAARSDSGAVALIVAILTVALLGMAAIVLDSGLLYRERRDMQTAADSAALAGVMELPSSPTNARAVAEQYALTNETAARIPTREYNILSTYALNDTIRVHVGQPAVGLTLARFLGMSSSPVGAQATAVVSSPSAYGSSVLPFGIMSKEPSGTSPFGYTFNESVTLKQPAQQGQAGNFQFLALTDPPGGHYGASDIYNALQNGGVPNEVFINTLYNTKTGINGMQVTNRMRDWIGTDTHTFSQVAELQANGTVKLLDPACHRLIVCPIVIDPGPPVSYNWTEMNGTSKPVKVIGFSYFFVESIGTSGNDCYITGRFIRPLTPDEATRWGPIDPYGAIGFRLIN